MNIAIGIIQIVLLVAILFVLILLYLNFKRSAEISENNAKEQTIGIEKSIHHRKEELEQIKSDVEEIKQILKERPAPVAEKKVKTTEEKTEPVKTEPEVEEEVSIEDLNAEDIVRLGYKKSFIAGLTLSEDNTKNWYGQLKNELLSYKKVHDRMSWKRESFHFGREQVARLSFRGKTLCLYLPLNPAGFEDSKFKVEDVSVNSSYADTPLMYRIKSDKRARYAKELIEEVMVNVGTQKFERADEDYYVKYRKPARLIEEGLIKPTKKHKSSEEFFKKSAEEREKTE